MTQETLGMNTVEKTRRSMKAIFPSVASLIVVASDRPSRARRRGRQRTQARHFAVLQGSLPDRPCAAAPLLRAAQSARRTVAGTSSAQPGVRRGLETLLLVLPSLHADEATSDQADNTGSQPNRIAGRSPATFGTTTATMPKLISTAARAIDAGVARLKAATRS